MLDEYQRDEALLHFQRGMVLERAHRVAEAVEEYRQAIARYPHLREAHDALGFYYQRYGLMAKAADEFRVAANLEDDFLSHFNLGFVLLDLARHEEAMDAFMRCLELIPDDPATHYEVASLHFLDGNYLDALTHVQIALQRYSEDWEIYKLRGRCMIQLGRYDEACTSFEAARTWAVRPAAVAEIDGLLESIERHREGMGETLKDQLYANEGVSYLGSAQDDGIHLEKAAEYHFTYPDIATTVRRMSSAAEQCDWQFTSVIALDRLAQPLAAALAGVLNLANCPIAQIAGEDRPLLVMAIGREAELLEVARERTNGRGISFCLGLNWQRRNQAVADINGVIVQGACSVPWEPELRRLRALGAPAAQIDRCLSQAAAQILAATAELGEDQMLAQQITYYAEDHRRLRFA